MQKQQQTSNGVKKIVIFSLAYFPRPVGGAEVAIKEITDRIADIEFHVVTQRFDASLSREEKLGNVFVHRIGDGASYVAKMLFVWRAARTAARLHRVHHFDAAWAMMSYMALPIMVARVFGFRVPYALTLQDGDPFEHVFKRLRILPFLPLLKKGFKQATVVQTISTYLAGWAGRMGYAGEVEVIPNGVNAAHFSQEFPAAVTNEIKDTLQKNMGDVFLVTTSRLVHKNAVDVVIRSLPLLPANIRFVVLGTGPDEAMLRALAKKQRVTERVHFVGHIEHEDLPKYLHVADIFIRPSRSEGMGISFIEAFAAGIPVIATQEGGLADFLFDEKRNPDKPITGWAVDVGSPEQIATAVKEIVSRSEKVRAVIATARQIAVEKYDWDLIARDMREKVFARVFTA
ncbi:MAG: glycosyltransferase family 4 protein [Minisyncoccia bacterium]